MKQDQNDMMSTISHREWEFREGKIRLKMKCLPYKISYIRE